MMDRRPVVYVPRSSEIARMIESTELSITPRAQSAGICIIAPLMLRPPDLMAACAFWPNPLRRAGVTRVGVVLGVEAYLLARPVFAACRWRLAEQRITIEYFHEGHLESDQIRAWFEQRRPRRRVSTDTLMKLSERYAARGDTRGASQARQLAESLAAVAA